MHVLLIALMAAMMGVLLVMGVRTTYLWMRDAWRRHVRRTDPKWIAVSQHVARQRTAVHRRQDQRRRQLVALQTVLTQLDRCDDFRRAANIAGHLSHLPAQHRQQIFARERKRLVRHFVRRLEAGESERNLVSSLTSLTTSLGIAPFEAEYIRREARRLAPDAAAKQGGHSAMRRQLDQLAREHRQRLSAIAATQGLDPALRENLRQAEIARYQRELFSLTGAETPDPERYLREQLAQRQPPTPPDADAMAPLADIEAAIRHATGAGHSLHPRRDARRDAGEVAS